MIVLVDPEQMTRPPAQTSPASAGLDGRMEKLSETARGWPHSADDAAAGSASIAVSDGQGRSWCGTLVGGPDGAVNLQTASGVVVVPSSSIATIASVATCG
jgi:hypothetical protein